METKLKHWIVFLFCISTVQSIAQKPIEQSQKKRNKSIFDVFLNYEIDNHSFIKSNKFETFKNVRDTGCLCLPDSIYISYDSILYGVQRFTYNSDGSINNVLNQTWNTNNLTWINNTLYTLTYDGNGNMVNLLRKVWNNASSIWVNSSQENYTYDASGSMASYLPQNWDNNNSLWVNSQQYIDYTWNAYGNNLSHINQFWNNSSLSWINKYKYINTFDNNENPLIKLTQKWVDSTSTWENYKQDVYTWDSLGTNISSAEQWWWPDSAIWVYGFHSTQTNIYNADGLLINMFYNYWGGTLNPTQYEYTFTYDANGNLLNLMSVRLNGSIWVNNSNNTFTYDTFGNEISALYQSWVINAWQNYQYTTHSYDSCGNLLTSSNQQATNPVELNQYFYPLSCNNAPQRIKSINNTNELKIFPNPANENIIIEDNQSIIRSILIYNTLGELMLQLPSKNISQQGIDISMLNSGVYFIHLLSHDGSVGVKKFVKN